ncbi:uncharacterized protein LOC133182497 [Saccostrea echinata]|uniref:uncharacterized protein LOC133182497 n=1 Tax=Saccostrea echinata TaxID=191078 RepID=UPI002A7F45C4|nr:uncharacterized protein LOC133182497 [Saccostrea echinata]
MDILDRVSKLNDQIEVIRAGGNAEGFQIRGSDIDQMYVDKLTKVVSTIPNDIGKSVALLRMVKPFDVPKGYVKLIVLTPFTPLQHIREAATKISNEYFLSNEVFLRSFQRHLTKGVRHGPCMLEKDDFGTEHDRAFCFEYKDWPIYANEWVSRRRKYGWPSSDLVKNIMRNGCHLMAIGSKSQDYTEFKYSMPEENPQWREDPFQWRLSFSVAEKKLVYSFNDTQFLTFGILKLLNNEVFSKDPIMKNCLCSYFLKTLMFWTIEDTPSEYWKPERLVFCVEVCLKRLIEWLDIGFCPNYFVRENNMFQGKVRESELKFTSENISEIYKEGWRCLLRCHSLSYLKKCLEDARRTMPCMNQNEDFKSLTSSRRHVENEEKEEVHDIGVFSEINSMFVAIPGRDPLEKELRNSVTIEMTEDLDRADLDILRLRSYSIETGEI